MAKDKKHRKWQILMGIVGIFASVFLITVGNGLGLIGFPLSIYLICTKENLFEDECDFGTDEKGAHS
jgi:hypothetical protein